MGQCLQHHLGISCVLNTHWTSPPRQQAGHYHFKASHDDNFSSLSHEETSVIKDLPAVFLSQFVDSDVMRKPFRSRVLTSISLSLETLKDRDDRSRLFLNSCLMRIAEVELFGVDCYRPQKRLGIMWRRLMSTSHHSTCLMQRSLLYRRYKVFREVFECWT